MKVLNDKLEIASDSLDEHGRRLDPEAQLARRTMEVEVTTSLGIGPTDPDAKPLDNGQGLKTLVTADQPALEAAQHMASRCSMCAYWDRAGFHAMRKAWEDPSNEEGYRTLQRLKGEMLTEGGKTLPTMDNLHGDMDDVEYTLGTVVGICRAFTEIDNVVTITFAHGGCPTANAAGEPMARLFRPRKGDSVKHSTRIYDQILRAAQGRPLSQ